jgi:hypothetical protein
LTATREVAGVAGPKHTQNNDVLRELSESWESAKAELSRLRASVDQAVRMGEAQGELGRRRGEREAALLKLGEAFYKLVQDGAVDVPAALKRAVGEVKAKEAELLRQQADIAAILKEADALVEKSRKTPAKKKSK